MTSLAVWTGVAIGVLIVVPLIVFAFFLRDAVVLLREMKEGPKSTADRAAAPSRPPP